VTTEFAYFEPGPTRNPHDPEHTPGGSSSGSAAAVAAGYCELALGTQTVGSVIRPAAFCGVVGFKPSYGRVPTGGLLLCSPSVDTIGLFARHVATVRRGAAVVVAGWDARAMEAALGGDTKPVLGVPDGPYLRQASPEGMPVFDEQVARLQAGGYRVERVEAMADIEAVNERHRALQAGEMAIEHGAWMDEHLNLYRQRTREILLRGREVPEGRLREARDGRAALRSRLHDAMDSAGIDLWISPSATGPAPRGIDSTGDPIMNLPWTHAGMPALSLPAGWVGRLPVGLQVVGRFGGDEEVIGWGKALCVLLG
jgi:Asp-tRNA(Asn)/Glu-tRNA(Gln) amidotransferase A subunit family amidase